MEEKRKEEEGERERQRQTDRDRDNIKRKTRVELSNHKTVIKFLKVCILSFGNILFVQLY